MESKWVIFKALIVLLRVGVRKSSVLVVAVN